MGDANGTIDAPSEGAMTIPLLVAAVLVLDAPAQSPPVPALEVAIGVVVIPASVILSGRSGENSAGRGATMYGVTPSLDRGVSRHLTLGLAVPVVFNVREAQYPGESWTQAEVLLRLGTWLPVGAHVRLFGMVGSGIYRIFVPATERGGGNYGNPTGIAAVVGAGAQWAPTGGWFLSGDLGIHAGFGSRALGFGYPTATEHAQVGLGIGVPF